MYGEILDDSIDSYIVRNNIYPVFVNYFNNPVLTKVKDIGKYSMYACKIHAVLGIEHRYLIAFTNMDKNMIGTQIYMSNIHWECLQTRSMEEEMKVNLHSYVPSRMKDLYKKINLVKKDEESSQYNVEIFPMKVLLLPKGKNVSYRDTGYLINAIEEYQTVINWTV